MSTRQDHFQARERRKLLVCGIVQGVGFRPFVYALASDLGLSGWVLNNSNGVEIEIEGPIDAIQQFEQSLQSDAPPLSLISSLETLYVPCIGGQMFEILESRVEAEQRALIPSDVATCDLCTADIFEPGNRRYEYPFTNCTNCGPRFTIIEGIPYDRANTTMSAFTMCPDCAYEYRDPLDRRFHAQPNACPICGPKVTLVAPELHIDASGIEGAAELIRQGKIVAIKGLGGFHLACDARNNDAVLELRRRKGRSGKPFAIMAANIEEARKLVHISENDESVLTSPERPIVLLPVKGCSDLSENIAPENRYLGIMLPYTPLHHLLMRSAPSALIMTSGNLSEEPIAHKNDEAMERLAGIADAFLTHDREIYSPCDDSVVRPVLGGIMPIRRSRGYVPRPIEVGFNMPRVLACGAEQKNTFCFTQDSSAILSQHIGDLDNAETLYYYERAVQHFRDLFRIEPEIVAHDLHPDYLSTRYAQSLFIPKIPVQHHHAHVASCLAEHRMNKPIIGVAFDGTGFGDDGAIWGGEFLVASLSDFQRAAHLKYVRMPGGATAIKKPTRMAFAHLAAADLADRAAEILHITDLEQGILSAQIEAGLNSPLTSSMGRLFDSIAAIISLTQEATYEGEPAVLLEMCADDSEANFYRFEIEGSPMIINAAPVVSAVLKDKLQGVPKPIISARFHNAVSMMIVDVCKNIRDDHGLSDVALTGGCFQNVRLIEQTARALEAEDFNVLLHRLVPPNDGGISLGQAVVAAAQGSKI